MKSAFWLVVGVAAGFVAAHYVSKTPQGRALFEEIDDRTRGFGAAVLDGYRSREAELRDSIRDAEDAIADITKRLK
ncbi:hypothetical protein [Schumannella sp. 10F1B-5-1]|uniref:hypothetical protein n=1 Tax=Schumannella sp. 10F1B-5-1 TaxID=2590780 RepID=UPI001131A81B|nr:hypothetical protein [Schumannella sp. 10F1B-5-1]TPW71049.1 hypothetical protein FJ658_13245 [Schumannella sp. 10F1B-5-1]